MKKLRQSVFRPLFLLMAFLSVLLSASAWNGYGIKSSDGKDYWGLTWDSDKSCYTDTIPSGKNGLVFGIEAYDSSSQGWYYSPNAQFGDTGGEYNISKQADGANGTLMKLNTNKEMLVSVFVDKNTQGWAPVKIKLEGLEAPLYYIKYSGSWGKSGIKIEKGQEFTLNGGEYFVFASESIDLSNGSNWDKGLLYSPASDKTFNASESGVTATYGKKACYKFKQDGTATYTVRIDEFNPGSSVKFTVTKYNGGGGDDTDIPQSLYLRTNWNSWSDTDAYRMKWNATEKTFTCDFDYISGGDFKFHFIEKRNSSWSDKGTVLYPDNNNTPISQDYPLTIPHVGTVSADPNTCWLYQTSTSEKIRVIVDFSDSQPTVRIVKYTETPKPHLAGNIYLMGTMLNDNVASPAWQMIPQGDGTYLIENFSMRFTENKGNDNNKDVTFGVCKFNEQGVKTYPLTLPFDKVQNLNVPTPQANGQQVRKYYVQPGWAYRAINNGTNLEP